MICGELRCNSGTSTGGTDKNPTQNSLSLVVTTVLTGCRAEASTTASGSEARTCLKPRCSATGKKPIHLAFQNTGMFALCVAIKKGACHETGVDEIDLFLAGKSAGRISTRLEKSRA